MRLALDAMGGDHAPAAMAEGAASHVRQVPGDSVILVGDERRLSAELSRLRAHGRVEICHAPDAVGMGEAPSAAARRKKHSSLRVAFRLVRERRADAVVSAGSSGAAVTAGLLELGRLRGVLRAAIAATLPVRSGGSAVLLDAGATVECRPAHLVGFAFLGEVWARRVLGVARPRVAVLSNGAEPSKGTATTRAAAALLAGAPFDFVGYVEGNDLFSGAADVVVTDGFTGNVVLKAAEGAGAALGASLARELEARTTARLGAWLAAPALAAFRKLADWSEVGGAPLLGLDGVAVLAHGRSGPRAVRGALRVASLAATRDLGGELSRAALAARALARAGERPRDEEARQEE